MTIIGLDNISINLRQTEGHGLVEETSSTVEAGVTGTETAETQTIWELEATKGKIPTLRYWHLAMNLQPSTAPGIPTTHRGRIRIKT